ncbi:MAG: type IV secretory system conjugative DNA transfer family protein [Planctomycetes bacterium]|nr:type IV secretory system conjugative DNA transfer family protein [Planctomycetota bacterium]
MERERNWDRIYQDTSFWFDDGWLKERPRRASSSLYGSARIARERDLGGLLRAAERDAFSTRFPLLTVLVENEDGRLDALCQRELVLETRERASGILAVGMNGSGKTQENAWIVAAEDYLHPERFLFAVDVKGGRLTRFLRALSETRENAKAIDVVNFRYPRRSLRWNPVEGARSKGVAREIAQILCRAVNHDRTTTSDSPFWEFSSTDLLASMLRQGLSLGEIRDLLAGSHDRLRHAAQGNDEFLRFVAFVESGSHNAETIFQDLRMRMGLFLDEGVRATTSGTSEVDFERVVQEPRALILEVDESDTYLLRGLTSLFVSSFLSAVQRIVDEGRTTRPGGVILDELGSAMGELPDFAVRLNTLRERRVGIVGVVQSLAQLDAIYGRHAGSVRAGFASKIFFPPLEPADAQYAAVLAGTMTAESVQETVDYSPDGEHVTGRHRIFSPVPRPLWTPEEIGAPRRHELLGLPRTWFLNGHPPFQAFHTPAWRVPHLAEAVRRAQAPRDDDADLRAERVRRHAKELRILFDQMFDGSPWNPDDPDDPDEAADETFLWEDEDDEEEAGEDRLEDDGEFDPNDVPF